MSRMLIAVAVWFFSVALVVAGDNTAKLLQDLKSSDLQVRLQAIQTLGDNGQPSLEVLQALSRQLKDKLPLVRAHAASALGHFGPAARPAIEALAPLVTDSDARVRRMAIRALARIRPGPEVSVPLLVKAMKDTDPAVRTHVLTILAEIGKPAVPALVKALKNEKSSYWACLVLAEIGPDAADAAPGLAELLASNAKPEVRREATLALGKIGSAAAPAVPTLTKTIEDKDPAVCCGAAFALGCIGPKAKSAEAALAKCADGDNRLLQTVAAWALAKIEPEDAAAKQKAVTLLTKALGSKISHLRRAALRGLLDLQTDPEVILQAIKNAHINSKDDIVEELLVVSSEFGEPAVPLLVESLNIERVRPLAASRLGQIGPKAKAAVSSLSDIVVKDKNVAARCEALMALGAIAPGAPETLKSATVALSDPEEDIRYAACYVLGRIGKPAAATTPELKKMLVSQDEFMALVSAWALAHIDPASAEIAKESVPVLVRGLNASESRIRYEAVTALGLLGPLAKDAIPALKAAADDKDDMVADAAEKSLANIGR